MAAKLKLVKAKASVAKRDVAKRWTAKLAKGGFTPVVTVFLEHYARMSPPLTTPECHRAVKTGQERAGENRPS